MSSDKEYFEDSELTALANDVIAKEGLSHLLGVSIKYIFVSPEISRTVHARCIRGSGELRHYAECDFLIEFSHKVWQTLNDKIKYALMWHTLMHPIVSQDEKSGKVCYKMSRHDINDFGCVISKFNDWFVKFKEIVGQTYEMRAKEIDQIQV